jgi:hypothetical protein
VPKVTSALLVLLAVSLPACGGGGGGEGNTFEGDGYSFTYPKGWEELDAGEANPGASLLTAFGPGPGLDALIFEVADGGSPVDENNIGAMQDELAAAIQPSTEGPTRLTVAGLPALRIVAHPQSGRSRRVTTAFDGTTMYIFDCGYSDARAQEMKQGCNEIEQSFELE